jgi:hypothetical protein
MMVILNTSTVASEVLMAVKMKTVVFWDMKPCRLVDGLEHFLKKNLLPLFFSVPDDEGSEFL